MVQIINPSPYAMQQGQIGQALGMGVAKNFQDPQQMVQRNLLKNALQEAKASMNDPNATPIDTLFSLIQAGAGIPGSERYMGALIPEVLKISQANASQKVPLGLQDQQGVQQGNAGISDISATGEGRAPTSTQQSLQNFLQDPNQNAFYPSNVGEQQAPGNLPEAATVGRKLPVASTQQLLEWSKEYAAKKTQAGIPTTPIQAYEELKAMNADNKESNMLVEQERKERVASQREYGDIGTKAFLKVNPNASDEEIAYIKRQVEQLAGENKSEADIERLAAGEARKYKNMISKVESGLSPQRSYNRPYRTLMGTSKSAEKERNDVRVKIQPLLDAGLYDKARSLLSENGYYPEEREMIVSNLGENSVKTINRMPKIKTNIDRSLEDGYTQGETSIIKQNIKEVLKSDPSANLILLRPKYEDSNVNWRIYKDTINESIDDGTFQPTEDQFNQLKTLEEPPLDTLDKILYGLGIIGR